MNFNLLLLVLGLLVVSVTCVPKFDDGSFKPSSVDYTEKSAKSQDQVAMSSQSKRNDADLSKNANDLNDRSQEPRFGFTNVGDSSGYGVSSYAPARIDLGGLLLGAVIGIGTILVIPKLLYVLSGSYGAYARSSEDGGIAHIMTRLDDALAQYGIDTTSCMQRVACSYSKQAAETMRADGPAGPGSDASTIDRLVDAVSSNEMLRAALRGTAIQEALETGRNGQNCAKIYAQCGMSTETILALMAKLAASNVAANVVKSTAAT